MIPHSADKAGGRKEGDIWSDGVCLPKSPLMRDRAWLPWGWLSTCLLVGSSELIPCLALFVHTVFTLPITFSLSQLITFFHFYSSSVFLHPTAGEVREQLHRANLLAGIKPQQSLLMPNMGLKGFETMTS